MKNELDRLLDDALACYSLEEPRAGLSARVMARVCAAGSRSRGVWWLLAVATAAVACIVIAMMLRPHQTRPQQIAKQASVVLARPEIHPPVVAARRKPVRRLPRRDRFPSPAPLTEEERSLLAFARIAPEVARQLAEPDKPLEVQAITIRPIEIDGLPNGENQ